jgi:hypothetical protein
MDVPSLVSLWITAAITLMIFSVIVKENYLFRLAEYLFIGAGAAQTVTFNMYSLEGYALAVPGGKYYYLVGFLFFGPVLLFALTKKYEWLGRYGASLLLGVGVGLATRGYVDTQVVQLITKVTKGPFTAPNLLSDFNGWFMFLGTICIMSFFLFEKRLMSGLRGRTFSALGRLGRYLMMAAFGGYLGNQLMGFIVLVYARLDVIAQALGLA